MMRLHETDAELAGRPHLSTKQRAQDAAASAQPASDRHTGSSGADAVLKLQRLAGNAGVSGLLAEEEVSSPAIDVIGRGAGSPLDTSTRGLMEGSLGYDFGDVRIHTGEQADQAAQSISAQAYTVGADVVFRNGKYAPETETGRRILAHELTHVIQQKSGPVSGTEAAGGIRVSDPSDAFEQAAERAADRAMSAMDAPRVGGSADHTPPHLQREVAITGENAEVQHQAVQRQDDDDGGTGNVTGLSTGGGGGAGQWSIDNLSTNAHIALEGTSLKKAVIVVASDDQGSIGLK